MWIKYSELNKSQKMAVAVGFPSITEHDGFEYDFNVDGVVEFRRKVGGENHGAVMAEYKPSSPNENTSWGDAPRACDTEEGSHEGTKARRGEERRGDAVTGGRGEEEAEMERIVRVVREDVAPSPLNPRKTFDPAYLTELAATIKANGIIHALVVRPIKTAGEALYELVAGECRWRAAALAGLDRVPVVVRELSDRQVLEMMLAENMKRRDLTPLEEMDAFAMMLAQRSADGELIYNQTTLAEKIGVSAGYVRLRLQLSRLSPVGRVGLADGRISIRCARVICQCPSSVIPQVEDEVLNPKKYDRWRDSNEPLTMEETVDVIKERYVRDLSRAPFDVTDAGLVPVHCGEDGERLDGGACADCPWNSANQEAEAQEGPAKRGRPVERETACLNVGCFARKVEIHVAAALAKAKDNGAKVLTDKDAEKMLYANGTLKNQNYVKLDAKLGWDERAKGLDDRKAPTWRKVVAGESTPPIVVAVDGEGRVHELVERKLAIVAATENGNERFLSLGTGRGKSLQDADAAAQDKAEREKVKQRIKLSTAVLAELVGAVETRGVTEEIFGVLRAVAVRHAGNAGCTLFCKRRGIDRGASVIDAADCALRAASGRPLAGMIVELLLAQDWAGCHSSYESRVVPDHAKDLLTAYGVSVDGVKAAQKKDAETRRRGDAETGGCDEEEIRGAAETVGRGKEEAEEPTAEPVELKLEFSAAPESHEWADSECQNPQVWELSFPASIAGAIKGRIYLAQDIDGKWYSGGEVDHEDAGYVLLPNCGDEGFEFAQAAIARALTEMEDVLEEYSDREPCKSALWRVGEYSNFVEGFDLEARLPGLDAEDAQAAELDAVHLTDAEVEKMMPWCASQKKAIDELPKQSGPQIQFNVAYVMEGLDLSYANACRVFDACVDWDANRIDAEVEKISGEPVKAAKNAGKKGGAK